MEARSGGGMLHTKNEKVEEGGMLISCCLIPVWTGQHGHREWPDHKTTHRKLTKRRSVCDLYTYTYSIY